MSAVAEILTELSHRGVVVRADGERIGLKPKAALDDSLLARVQANKRDILAVLSGCPATCAPSCYEVEPSGRIHHPWDGCKTPMPESAEPIIPARADCGCPGSVCPRCWLCPEHCQHRRHPGESAACWHCGGGRRCACSTCALEERSRPAGPCAACRGTGKAWIQ
jgi:hypothetical protein